ncbi:MAG: MFS transporter [Bacteroidetes bacterium B1(2017)]|nr:MAG: MFS transporter [Bacteroidetes bacterium B1(2017)]
MTQEIDKPSTIWKVIGASSVGTLIEWYDFYIFGSLATILSKQFFPEDAGTAALLSTLAIFAAGFIVRPFGALVFGRLGDLLGRKFTFLLTLVLMGGSTFAIGLVPGYKTIGIAAPLIILALRLVQGLALGGEYGGAATYVAEHSPVERRGFFTSWIQTTATLGLFLSLGVILFTRNSLGVDTFNSWGWRVPFWVSIILVVVSIYIRLKMQESPLFAKIKKEGKISKNPLKESFGNKTNLKMVLLALFGAVMGQGVVWYTGQFYAQSFIENTCKVDFEQSRTILLWAILFATPFFIVFGALSDKIGRKWIMMTGMLLGILSYRPIYSTFLEYTSAKDNSSLLQADKTALKGEFASFDAKDDKKVLWVHKVDSVYSNGAVFKYILTDTLYLTASSGDAKASAGSIQFLTADSSLTQVALKVAAGAETQKGLLDVNVDHKSAKASVGVEKTMGSGIFWKMVFLVFIQIVYVTMVYGPIAAFLVELFPTRIRYTSMSLPYHIGNGVFGGLVPFLSTLIIEYTKTPENPTGSPLAGLWYPIGVAAICLLIGTLYLSNKIDEDVSDDENVFVHS